MRVKVHVRVHAEKQSAASAGRTLDLVVGPVDTVSSLKERVLILDPIPFPDTSLILDGSVLGDGQRLVDCGVKEGSSLDFVAKASEEALIQQLRELLQTRALTPNELNLLYCNQHGITTSQALKALGREEQLHDFLDRHKSFSMENGCVTALSQDEAIKPTPVTRELRPILEETVSSSEAVERPASRCARNLKVDISLILKTPSKADEVTTLDLMVSPNDTVLSVKERIMAREMIPFPDQTLWLDSKVLSDGSKLVDGGFTVSSSLVLVVKASEQAFSQQLRELSSQTLSICDLSLVYCHKHGVSVHQVLKMFGWGETFQSFLKRHGFIKESGFVEFRPEDACEKSCLPGMSPDALENQRYLDLHMEICSASFKMESANSLDRALDAIMDAMFLNVDHVVKGGSVGRCTQVMGVTDAEVVLFLNGLPEGDSCRWLPGLLKSVVGGLQAQLTNDSCIRGANIVEDAVQLLLDGPLTVDLRFAPVMGSYHETIRRLSVEDAHYRVSCNLLLAEQRVNFIRKQPEAVKVTIRLLKWWREQQTWSTVHTRPSDELLELVVVHIAATEPAPVNQRAAIENTLSLLAHFGEAQILWSEASRCYAENVIPRPMLLQRPLLMDPVDPFINVADPRNFDACELMTFARCKGVLPPLPSECS